MKNFLLLVGILLAGTSVEAQLNFSDRAGQCGINHRYLSSLLGGGVSFYDFNQDGLDDISLANAQGDPVQFYQNMGGHFMLLSPLVDNEDEVKQLLWVDFDNDGDQDLFLATYYGLNRLYENTGDLQMIDITLAAGLPTFNTQTFGACFGDYDRDGWVDLYFSVRNNGADDEHLFFRNNGDQTFTNVTESTQTADTGGRPFCSGFLDYNQDGWPDIYTAHDRMGNKNTLLENQGDGTFLNTGAAAGADIAIDAMSVTIGDYNNDTLIDIYVTNIVNGNNLLHNNGPNEDGQYTFSEVAAASGVGFYQDSWGAVFLDADNDCDLDLYVSGSVAGSDVTSAAFYQNEDDGTFSEPDLGFIGDTTQSYNNAIGDYNQDGYPDIMVINLYPFYAQLWSSPPLEHHWMKVSLQGVISNRNGIGTRLECYANDKYQQLYTQCGNGFLGQNSGTSIFGLGDAQAVDSLIVTWPSGHTDRYYNLPAGEQFHLQEGGSTGGDILPDPDTGLDALLVSTSAPTDNPLLKVYPNPAQEELFIVQELASPTQFRIINSAGQLVYRGKTAPGGTSPIDIHQLPAGIYYLLLGSEKQATQVVAWYKG
nr:FG-GAP-like repeat-containing protein [Lewinella cohaerens]